MSGYSVRPVPRERRPVVDRLWSASRKAQVHALVELDVTRARDLIALAEPHVSWTGFVISTLGRAVARHPEVNARRAGNKILHFEHVDVGATVERQWAGRTMLDVVVVREADRLSAAEVTEVLAKAKHSAPLERRPSGVIGQLLRLPGPIRRASVRMVATRPRVSAHFGPAVGVTSLGMFTRGWCWAIPLAPLTLIATVGGVVDRPAVREGVIVARAMLPLTVTFDHAVVDGAPAARFIDTMRELTETAAALGDIGVPRPVSGG